ncbi:MAG TPA: hypothetical protein VGL77_16225 [Armatimonadota bacterium]|jgi:hypothetical protein
MGNLAVFLALMAVALGFVSVLLYISLGSRRVPTAKIVRLLIELWGTFALLAVLFALLSAFLGAPPAGSLAEELAVRLAHWRDLSSTQQAILVGGLLLAIVLFVHLINSLRVLQGRSYQADSPDEGE